MLLPTLTVLMMAPAAPSVDAPDRLMTPQGVEFRSDEDVFVLFAALNALGYGEETRRKGPPLRAPVYHAIRIKMRDALRTAKGKDAIRKLFDSKPAEISTYVEAVLARQMTNAKPSKKAQQVSEGLAALDTFRNDASLEKLFDTIAADQRAHGKKLMVQVQASFRKAAKLLGEPSLSAPRSLVVVPNPLDGHDIVRRVYVGDKLFLVVGPGFESATNAVVVASLLPVVQKYVDGAWGSARGFNKAWSAVSQSRRIKNRYKTGQRYLAHSLARAVAYRVGQGGKRSSDADDDFVDGAAKDGLRWAPAALRVVNGLSAGKPMRSTLKRRISRMSL